MKVNFQGYQISTADFQRLKDDANHRIPDPFYPQARITVPNLENNDRFTVNTSGDTVDITPKRASGFLSSLQGVPELTLFKCFRALGFKFTFEPGHSG